MAKNKKDQSGGKLHGSKPLRSRGASLARVVLPTGRLAVAKDSKALRKAAQKQADREAQLKEPTKAQTKAVEAILGPPSTKQGNHTRRRSWQVASLHAMGYSAKEIAAKLGLDISGVNGVLDNLNDVYLERASEKVALSRGQQAAQIDGLLGIAVEGLKASRCRRERTTTELIARPEGTEVSGRRAGSKIVKQAEDQNYDPNFIFAAKGLLQRKAQVLGTDAPTELRVVLETLEDGKKRLIESVARHVKDPAILRAIAEDLSDDGTKQEEDGTIESEEEGQ